MLEKIGKKLVGNENERAVSPVIGVILMVAITVILAAVIATFVLDLGDSLGNGQVNAVVGTDLDNSDQTIEVTVENMGDASEFIIRGDFDGTSELTPGSELDATGDQITLAADQADSSFIGSSDDELDTTVDGEIRVVAVSGDDETIVATQDWSDWT